MDIKWIGAHTNNYTSGRGGKSVDKIVMHWIVGTLESADATFANPDRKASAHYGIGDKEIHQYVREEDTAWHASNYGINQTSIGIEHEGGWLLDDGTRFKPTDETHQTSAELVADICRRCNLPINRDTVHAHNEYSATQCPGSLDLDRIIAMANDINKPTPPVGGSDDVIDDPQQKLQLNSPWGVQELQATRSILNDQKRAIENCENACNDRINNAIEQAYSEKDEFWQPKLTTANNKINELNQTISNLDKKKLSEYDWNVLLKQAWINYWNEKRGD